jgi:hypothetical protein
MVLLIVWTGPVTLAQTDTWGLLRSIGAPGTVSADDQVIPAGRALQIEPGTKLKILLHDGTSLEGRFVGRTLLDSRVYEVRFAAHARASSDVPLTLGETLHVALRDGREMTAAFAGYGELTLLLRDPGRRQAVRVPFESSQWILRANGDRIEPSALARSFRAGMLPSTEALTLQKRTSSWGGSGNWSGPVQVAVEDIASAVTDLSPFSSVSGQVLLSIFLSAVVAIVVLKIMVDDACASGSLGDRSLLGDRGASLTTRPFDRSRGCFVGDPLAVADPFLGSAEVAALTPPAP